MSAIQNCLPETDYPAQIRKIVEKIYIKGEEIYFQGSDLPKTEDVRQYLLRLGIETRDIFTLLSNYIYRKYYVNPSSASVKVNVVNNGAPIEDLRYDDIDPCKKHYYQDDYWLYAEGLFNNRANTKMTLRKGSQAAWVRNGSYAEYSTTTDDDLPLIRTTAPTHTFSQESYTATYNWIFGAYKPDHDPAGFVRFYFNIHPTKHAGLILSKAIFKYFNLYEIPFTFKFLAYSEDYKNRTDTAVLYLEKRYLFPASFLLRDIYFDELKGKNVLYNTSCLFAKPLVEGISFGEDPVNSDSFGTSRCRAIAHILMKEALAEENEAKRSEKVLASLTERGYELQDFYKNPYSTIDYTKLFEIITNGCSDDKKVENLPVEVKDLMCLPSESRYLSAAIRIAIKLVKEAIWVQKAGRWESGWMAYMPDQENKITGYKYSFVTSVGDARENSEGIGSILIDVSKLFKKDIFTFTANSVIKEVAGIPPYYPEQEWYDEEISTAWKMLEKPEDWTREQMMATANTIIEKFLQEGRPLGNGFKTSEPERRRLFNPTIKYGLAGLGYFFLKIDRPDIITPGVPV